MEYRCEVQVSSDLIAQGLLDDESLFRKLACELVSTMPLEELHKLMKFSKIDPNSANSEEILDDAWDIHKIEKILRLRKNGTLLYSAKVKLI